MVESNETIRVTTLEESYFNTWDKILVYEMHLHSRLAQSTRSVHIEASPPGIK